MLMKTISARLRSELGCLLLRCVQVVFVCICVCVCVVVPTENRSVTVMNEHQNRSAMLSHPTMQSRRWSSLLLSQRARKTPTLRINRDTHVRVRTRQWKVLPFSEEHTHLGASGTPLIYSNCFSLHVPKYLSMRHVYPPSFIENNACWLNHSSVTLHTVSQGWNNSSTDKW